MLIAALFLTAVPGCDSQLEVENAAPRITWVAVHPPLDGEHVAEVTVWIADLEGDPVDLEIEVVREDDSSEELATAAGGHGLVGLTTQEARFDPNGQPHLLLWDVSGIVDERVQLRLAPDDQKGGAGDVVETPMFEVTLGMKDAVPVEVDE